MSEEGFINPEVEVNVKETARPDATLQLILACINILLCGSAILGIIALVFAVIASSENDYKEAENKLKIAKILNICGISFSLLVFVGMMFIYIMMFIGIFSISFLPGIL